jgi:hypothetical protein
MIKIDYTTGDSFRSSDETEIFGPFTLEEAKDNVRIIEKHYEFYLNIKQDGRFNMDAKEIKEIIKTAEKEDWSVIEKYPDSYRYGKQVVKNTVSFYSIMLTDNGNNIKKDVSWTGYFERLNEVSVVEDRSELDNLSYKPKAH